MPGRNSGFLSPPPPVRLRDGILRQAQDRLLRLRSGQAQAVPYSAPRLPRKGGVSGGIGTGTFSAGPYDLTSIGIDLGLVSSRLGTCTVSTPLS